MTLPEVTQAETIWISYKNISALSLYIVGLGSGICEFINLTQVQVADGSS